MQPHETRRIRGKTSLTGVHFVNERDHVVCNSNNVVSKIVSYGSFIAVRLITGRSRKNALHCPVEMENHENTRERILFFTRGKVNLHLGSLLELH